MSKLAREVGVVKARLVEYREAHNEFVAKVEDCLNRFEESAAIDREEVAKALREALEAFGDLQHDSGHLLESLARLIDALL